MWQSASREHKKKSWKIPYLTLVDQFAENNNINNTGNTGNGNNEEENELNNNNDDE